VLITGQVHHRGHRPVVATTSGPPDVFVALKSRGRPTGPITARARQRASPPVQAASREQHAADQARQLNPVAASRLNTTGHGRSNRQAGRGHRPIQSGPRARHTAWLCLADRSGRGHHAFQVTAVPSCIVAVGPFDAMATR
jgi:hypothetical protein